MTRFNFIFKIWRHTAVRVTLGIAVLFLSLLLALNFILVRQSQQSFVNVLQGASFFPAQVTATKVFPYGAYTQEGGIDILRFDLQGNERPKPLEQLFVERFQNSLIWIGFVGLLGSVFIGIIIAQIVNQPVKRLTSGITDMRNNNYRQLLEPNDTAEFDPLIAEYNRLVTQLQVVEDLRKELISDTSHELKTPLTSLKLQLEGMQDGVVKAEPKRISALLDQVNRLSDVVERLQQFTRMRNRNYEIKKGNIKVAKFINDSVVEHQTELDLAGIKVTVECDSKLQVKADKGLLSQVFTNLIMNTAKYSKAKNLYIIANQNSLVLQDDGQGVPEESLPYLFERFYRVDKSRNRDSGGLGLGLAIVKEICQAHGWTIVASNKDGLRTEIIWK